ncbi:MAG: zinc dependent phospholipase C family protein [Desulfuromonadales bacterium]|nr:zinc dependent phospholipase C family protein [Desulfuromonadales bacterium]
MAGPYAHITLLHGLMNALHDESRQHVSEEVISAVRDHFHFCVLGAVSPDFPSLATDGSGSPWADAMHYIRSGEMIVCGVRHVAQASAETQPRLLAWLLGYCAHVVTDVTIHPVVRARVGDYAENQRRHRLCEMNQDAHIFARMNRGELRDSNRFARDIVACCQPGSAACLDRDVAFLWDRLLREVHPALYNSTPPLIREWFDRFCDMATTQAGQGGKLFPLAALISAGIQRDYPRREHIDQGFVESLATPSGGLMHYDAIFDKAAEHVCELWNVVGRGVVSGDRDHLSRFGNWDLDTGLDERGQLVFWGHGYKIVAVV